MCNFHAVAVYRLQYVSFNCYMFFLLFIVCQSELSIAVVNRQTNTIVGGDFLFNYFIDDLEQLNLEYHDSMRPIFALLDLLEHPVKRRLANERDLKRRQSPAVNYRLLSNYCLFVDVCRLTPGEQVKVCQLIEDSVLEVAKRNGFSGVITSNTNHVNQVCSHHLAFRR
jgi:hypothetical protein